MTVVDSVAVYLVILAEGVLQNFLPQILGVLVAGN